MKKAQAIKFWKRLDESTSEKVVISAFAHDTGYPSGHTLRRYVQVHTSFKQGQASAEIAKKTGWSIDFVEKIKKWWESVFTDQSPGDKAQPVVPSGFDTSTLLPERLKVFTQALERHRREVVQATIPRIKGITVYTAEPIEEHFKLMKSWYNRPWDNLWPIIREGEITGSASDKLLVHLFVEEKVEWHYLLQHFKDTPFQASLTSWKKATLQDIKSRLNLFNKVATKVQSELNLPVVSDLQSYTGPGIDLYYVFALYAEALHEGNKGIDFSPVREDPFTKLSPDAVYVNWSLNVRPIIRSPDQSIREKAVKYAHFYKLDQFPEAIKARQAYLSVQKATNDLKRQADEIRLAIAFPSESTCDGCRPWLCH